MESLPELYGNYGRGSGKMKAEDITKFMDIADLQTSTRFIMLMNEIIELEVTIDALTSLVQASNKLDSHALEVAKQFSRNKPEFAEKKKMITGCTMALKKAADDPKARLQAMLQAKMAGKY